MKYGCVGAKLGYSFSQEIHALCGNLEYDLLEMGEEAMDALLRDRDFAGINVTMPYKERVLSSLDELTPLAAEIGAVNVIINRNGRLLGDNTDALGLRLMLQKANISLCGKTVMILGSGGTSKTASAVACGLGAAKILIVSRTEQPNRMTYDQVNQLGASVDVLINTTPCGMFPKEEPLPLSLDALHGLEAVADVVYHPLRSALVVEAQKRGLKAVGGLYMLVAQAVASEAGFFQRELKNSEIDDIYRRLLQRKENLVLAGMPGCGKTTFGRQLAEYLRRPFFDTDELVEKKTGRSPEAWLNENGERAFREAESAVVREVSQMTGAVIATGGGAVLSEENTDGLKRNGRILFLNRSLEELKADKEHPLSDTKEKLEALYQGRQGRYLEVADDVLENLSPEEYCQKRGLE